MDVSREILNNIQMYGASDNTSPQSLAASKSLNYAKGATIQKPVLEKVSVVPRLLKYADSVGLFGAENVFIRVDLNIKDTGNFAFEETGWQSLKITQGTFPVENTYITAEIDVDKDLDIVNTYEPAIITNDLASIVDPYVGVTLANLKTGNKYIDCWFDVRLYTKSKEEHPYDVMFLPTNDYFYIGFHARNTKRLPYNVECLVGTGYKSKNDVDPRLIAKIN
tara:strand:- start:57 stop:722 length:666 start_codon:yes stop_codon:yes gene_type:complete